MTIGLDVFIILAGAGGLVLALPRPRRALRNGLRRLVLHRTAAEGADALREGLVDAISTGHNTGAMQKDARDRLLGALDLTQRTVDEIMRHRRQIEMIDADSGPERILTQALASPHTRLPVFRGSDDNITVQILRIDAVPQREPAGIINQTSQLPLPPLPEPRARSFPAPSAAAAAAAKPAVPAPASTSSIAAGSSW